MTSRWHPALELSTWPSWFAILMLIGAIILWLCSWLGISVPVNVQRGYIAVVR